MTNEAIFYIVAIFSVTTYFYYVGNKAEYAIEKFEKNEPLPFNFKLIYAIAIATIFINMLFSKGGGFTAVIWGYLLWNFHKRDIAGAVKTAKINCIMFIALSLVGCIGVLIIEKKDSEIEKVILKILFFLCVVGGAFLHSIYYYIKKFSESLNGTDNRNIAVNTENEKLYEEIFAELSSNDRRNGVWAVALANNNGDESKAKAEYIRKRVAEESNAQSEKFKAVEVVSERVKTYREKTQSETKTAITYFIIPTVVIVFVSVLLIDKNLITNLLDGDKKTFVAIDCNECDEDGCKKVNQIKSIEVDAKERTFRIYFTGKNGETDSVLRGVNENCAFSANPKFSFGCTGSSTSNIGRFNFSSRSNTNFDGTYFLTESYARTIPLPERLVFRQQCRMQ